MVLLLYRQRLAIVLRMDGKTEAGDRLLSFAFPGNASCTTNKAVSEADEPAVVTMLAATALSAPFRAAQAP